MADVELSPREDLGYPVGAPRPAAPPPAPQPLLRTDPHAPWVTRPGWTPRPQKCARCSSLAEVARRHGQTAPHVRDADYYRRPVGLDAQGKPLAHQRHYTGLCRECGDWDWSQRFAAREAEAKRRNDQDALDALRSELETWMRRGRHYYGGRR